MLRFKLYEKKSKVKINPKKEDCMEAKKHVEDCTCKVCEERREKTEPTVEDWKPEITHSKMGDATKAQAEKKRKEAEKSLPPHLRLSAMKKAFAHTNEENELEKRAKENEKARKWLKKDAKKSGYTDIALKASMSKGAGVSESRLDRDPPSQFGKGDDDRGNPDYMKSVSYADEKKWERLQRMRRASKKKEVRAKATEEVMHEIAQGVVGQIKKGVKRHKDAVQKKKIKDRKAVPYAALAAQHEPKGEEIKEAPLVSDRKKDWPKGSIDTDSKKMKLAKDLINLEKQGAPRWTVDQLKKKHKKEETEVYWSSKALDQLEEIQKEERILEKFSRQYKDKSKLGQSSQRKSLGRGASIKDGAKKRSYESPKEHRDTSKKLAKYQAKGSYNAHLGEMTLMSFQEKTRYAKETGKSFKSGKAQPKGGSAKGDAAFKSVIAKIKSEYGKNALVGGEGQMKKIKGEKGRQQPGDRRGKPADTIARRRQMKKDAEAAMRDTRGT